MGIATSDNNLSMLNPNDGDRKLWGWTVRGQTFPDKEQVSRDSTGLS